MKEIIHLKSYKYPNIPHYEWKGQLLQKKPDYAMVLCEKGRELKHHTKGITFTIDVTSLEYFFFKEGFTVAMEVGAGEILSYYCNIATPSVFEGDELRYIDLDLDLIKKRNENWQVIDKDEFESNAVKYSYPPDLKSYALKSLELLRKRINTASFPFDGSGLDYLSDNKLFL
ncbi:protein associated with RNAses G and E [Terribacillus aidingensis]|uniref:Protein associated with RNAses G and E n=1 Tax=Terribacillus aidingensis TaxID=586416 RepID=A0A285P1Y4_9BACI|nr:DUF402 domain-containing protein [Terribacillus aidingensis]SNZ14166.1 protein associated with RNAses G and E [Terribacillus aidingensis]